MSDATDSDGGGPAPSDIGLFAIFVAFLQLGCSSFGGGTAGWLYREIVLRRRWLDERAFLADMALSQTLPGSQGVKLTLLIGQRLGGGAGAILAPLGLLGGPFAIILAIAAIYGGLGDYRIVHAVLDGVAAAVVGLTFATGLRGIVRGSPDPASIAVAAAAVLGVGILGWPILPVMLGLAPVSIGLAAMRR